VRIIGLLALAALLLPVAMGRATAQISIYPPVLYPGINVVTITADEGLVSINASINGGRWGTLTTGYETPRVRVISSPTFARCARKASFMILVKSPSNPVEIELQVRDCQGNSRSLDIEISETWQIDRQNFGQVRTGSTACQAFSVRSQGGEVILDSVMSPSAQFPIRYTMQRPPIRLRGGGTYYYDVCFTATTPGVYKMPIYTYIRRQYPAGGFTNFIVADTAYVTVVGAPIAALPPTPRPPKPTSPVLIAPPRPLIIPKPPPKPEPPRVIPPVVAARARTVPTIVAEPVAAGSASPDPMIAPEIPESITDPTTHRVVLMPTARSLDSGRIFVSNYELAGFLAGYGVGDRLTLLAGGAYVPEFISRNVVGTAGGRYEFFRRGIVRAAAGAQANYARSETSTIVLLSPYAVASIGDDDRRASLALGYTWRHHTPIDSTVVPFNRQAAVLALGGDYRIGRNWKLAAEAYLLEDADLRPFVLTARYFTRSFAIDAGLGLAAGSGADRGVTLAPVVTATWVW